METGPLGEEHCNNLPLQRVPVEGFCPGVEDCHSWVDDFSSRVEDYSSGVKDSRDLLHLVGDAAPGMGCFDQNLLGSGILWL